MKIEELTFPLTVEMFAAYQEAGVKRELRQRERDTLQPWVPVINHCYECGADGDAETMGDTLDGMEACLAQAEGNAIMVRILKSMRWWMCYAYQQGQKDAEKEVDRL